MKHKVHPVNFSIPTNLIRFPFGRSTYYVLKRLRGSALFRLPLAKVFNCHRNGVGPPLRTTPQRKTFFGVGPPRRLFSTGWS